MTFLPRTLLCVSFPQIKNVRSLIAYHQYSTKEHLWDSLTPNTQLWYCVPMFLQLYILFYFCLQAIMSEDGHFEFYVVAMLQIFCFILESECYGCFSRTWLISYENAVFENVHFMFTTNFSLFFLYTLLQIFVSYLMVFCRNSCFHTFPYDGQMNSWKWLMFDD